MAMSEALILAFLFFMGCIIGWGIEVIFRRFKKENVSRKWVNPGFLVGPYLPLYGFGLCGLYLLASIENTGLIEEVTVGSKLILFIIMAIVMTLFEYIAGVIFIKGLHVQLWDYSKEKFNFQGIICLKFSIFWALLSAAYYFLVHPRILNALQWLSHNLQFSFFIGVFFGIFTIDVVYSLNIVAKVRAFAKEKEILVKYEELRAQIRENAEQQREKLHWFLRFQSGTPLREHLAKYAELKLNEIEDFVRNNPVK